MAQGRLARSDTPRLMIEPIAPALLLPQVSQPLMSPRPLPSSFTSDRVYALMCIVR